jgi:hypothetical protein
MPDQFLTRIFSSWIVAILVLILLALAEFGCRMGLARSRAKPEEGKDGGSVPTARLTLLGLLLGFSFAMAVSPNTLMPTRRPILHRQID